MFREELISIITETWTAEQVASYIKQLEDRMTETHELIRELRPILRRKLGKKVYDTGPRGGM